MKECDIFMVGSKHTLTSPTYLQGSKPPTPCVTWHPSLIITLSSNMLEIKK